MSNGGASARVRPAPMERLCRSDNPTMDGVSLMAKGGCNKGRPDMTDADYVAKWKAKCIVMPNGCWEWQGWRHPQNSPRQLPYAEASYRGNVVRLHRKMLEIKLGRLLEKTIQACHECDNPPCINPDHVFEGTNTQNQRDMVAKGRHTKQKRTHCKRFGHPLSGENLWIRKDGRRVCKACSAIKCRLQMGWSLEEAITTPKFPQGARTPRRTFQYRKSSALSAGGNDGRP